MRRRLQTGLTNELKIFMKVVVFRLKALERGLAFILRKVAGRGHGDLVKEDVE